MTDTDVAVIGAGVIGLAIAQRLSLKGKRVSIIEAGAGVGAETSARGSHIVHSGIYYTPGSLKATLCVRGKELLYSYCNKRNVAYKKLGKIILATTEKEVETLEHLKEQGEKNGVTDLQWLSAHEVHEKEPAVRCARLVVSIYRHH